ncbi:MAG TPA: hypothetical protein VGP03_09440 [Pseudonocardiaceae bacterium]|nr:hypothetical protein [Pseudonocardiaceae bacterium]
MNNAASDSNENATTNWTCIPCDVEGRGEPVCWNCGSDEVTILQRPFKSWWQR